MSIVNKITAIDSHTGGEPTRIVIGGFPDLGNGPIAARLEKFRTEFDHLRSAIVNEPRGHSAIVGALLCEPTNKDNAADVVFFNNVGYLRMCGHGTIGLIKTLEYLGRISAGIHKVETPAGTVDAELNTDGSVSIANVPSYRYRKDVKIDVPKLGTVCGDIAWGGNWFFLIKEHPLVIDLANLYELTRFSVAIRGALSANHITGENDGAIDHIELFSSTPTADSRNFVLCPGLDYDRSPCGTGTSAKLACLYADGELKEGDIWRQESLIGSVFEGRIHVEGDRLIPIIRGRAYITAEVELILDGSDPYRFGIVAR
ncbi:MAG TPA: proline racemase family protein [Pyrinomonadaceae bacterium]